MGRKEERAAVPLLLGRWVPHLTEGSLDQGLLHTKWHLHSSSHLTTVDIEQKLVVGLCPF